MDAINRLAVLVMPAQPFLDWLHRADPTSAELSLEDLRREPTIYLLPEYDTEEEAHGYLREYCSEIFEEELDSWYRMPSPGRSTGPSTTSISGLSTGFIP
jgi:hypothetical protein